MVQGIFRTVLVCSALFGVASCSSSEPDGRCTSDAECTLPGTRCDVEQAVCVCVTDEACEDGFFCNRAGVCQVRAGCTTNADCAEDDAFCDLVSGICLAGPALTENGTCGLASHCPFGTVCQAGLCVPGCFDDGDCPLGVVCMNGQCETGPGVCSTDAFCAYGQRCEENQCGDDRRGPYCRACRQATLQNPTPCDRPRNFCLLNNRELGGFTQFCGVDCSLGQACPNGYGCSNVIRLTELPCGNSAECQCSGPIRFATATCTVAVACDPGPDGTSCLFEGEATCNGGEAGGPNTCVVPEDQTLGNCTCTVDEDCADDQTCAAGLCCSGSVEPERECIGGEGTTAGFCTCVTDDDCPNNSCDGTRGVCAVTGDPCTPGNNECGPVPCVNGGCLIGQNCAPEQGLACSDVLP